MVNAKRQLAAVVARDVLAFRFFRGGHLAERPTK
jgi:hypothetical protein